MLVALSMLREMSFWSNSSYTFPARGCIFDDRWDSIHLHSDLVIGSWLKVWTSFNPILIVGDKFYMKPSVSCIVKNTKSKSLNINLFAQSNQRHSLFCDGRQSINWRVHVMALGQKPKVIMFVNVLLWWSGKKETCDVRYFGYLVFYYKAAVV